jgi:hypothetical protein
VIFNVESSFGGLAKKVLAGVLVALYSIGVFNHPGCSQNLQQIKLSSKSIVC